MTQSSMMFHFRVSQIWGQASHALHLLQSTWRENHMMLHALLSSVARTGRAPRGYPLRLQGEADRRQQFVFSCRKLRGQHRVTLSMNTVIHCCDLQVTQARFCSSPQWPKKDLLFKTCFSVPSLFLGGVYYSCQTHFPSLTEREVTTRLYKRKIFHHRLVVFSCSVEQGDDSGVSPGAGFASRVRQGDKQLGLAKPYKDLLCSPYLRVTLDASQQHQRLRVSRAGNLSELVNIYQPDNMDKDGDA